MFLALYIQLNIKIMKKMMYLTIIPFDGYCDEILKKIVICNMNTYPSFEKDTAEKCHETEKTILRHELIHAVLSESGLSCSSLQYSGGWAKNEEMIDFFAIQYPKIEKIMLEADKIHNQHIGGN